MWESLWPPRFLPLEGVDRCELGPSVAPGNHTELFGRGPGKPLRKAGCVGGFRAWERGVVEKKKALVLPGRWKERWQPMNYQGRALGAVEAGGFVREWAGGPAGEAGKGFVEVGGFV